MIVEFTLDPFCHITAEEVALLRPLLRGNPDIPLEEGEKKYIYYPNYTGDLSEISRAVPRLMNCIQLRGSELTPTVVEQLFTRLTEIMERSSKPGQQHAGFNDKVQVYMPGLGLLLMDRVMVLENCCTDALQSSLDDGWRILAICPQPDQRRPDYVLGKSSTATA